ETIRDEGGFDKVRPHYQALSPRTVVLDAETVAAWLDEQPEVDTARGVGALPCSRSRQRCLSANLSPTTCDCC
ncbi:MAG: hypothetical protein AAFQ44_06680, partial [Pseudomonadota bacterium]